MAKKKSKSKAKKLVERARATLKRMLKREHAAKR
jgi:hypothetical protein